MNNHHNNNKNELSPIETNPVRPIITTNNSTPTSRIKSRQRIRSFFNRTTTLNNTSSSSSSMSTATTSIINMFRSSFQETTSEEIINSGDNRVGGTSINDMRKTVDFHQYGKRCIIVGYNEECYAFKRLSELIEHVKKDVQQEEKDKNDTMAVIHHLNDFTKHSPVWIDIQCPSNNDLKIMEKYFGLHPLTSEDILVNTELNEKWENFKDYMYVIFVGQVDDELPVPPNTNMQHAVQDEMSGGYETCLHILVYENVVITVHEYPVKGLDVLLRRIEVEHETDSLLTGSTSTNRFNTNEEKQPQDLSLLMRDYDAQRSAKRYIHSTTSTYYSNSTSSTSTDHHHRQNSITSSEIVFINTEEDIQQTSEDNQPTWSRQGRRLHLPSCDWILYAWLDNLVDMYIPVVDSFVLDVDSIDEMVFALQKSEQDDLLRRIGVSKRNIVTLSRLLLPKRKLTTYLISHTGTFISDHVRFYLRDVMDHLEICLEKLEVARENLAQAHNNYMTKVQIDIFEASGRTDDLMNRITLMAAFWGPVNLIAGMWGMNVKVPGQIYNNLYPFFGLFCSMTIITLLLMIMFRNKFV
jgi:Mg2+ and Co2+ transporter CorA